jgi:hypothetical protein
MLVEFRTKNFRSLRDEQVLSLVATKDKTLQESNTMATGLKAAPVLVRSAVVYGANAGGKSNLVKALQCMREVIVESALYKPGQGFNYKPFLLDNVSCNLPTEFEVTFLLAGVRYQYGFAFNAHRIVSEHLLVYKAFKPQRWFERYINGETGKDVYEFGAGLKGPKHVWEGATRTNALFLSIAVQLNSEPLQPVFDWFVNHLVIINELTPLAPKMSVEMLKQPERRREICHVLNAVDISIHDIDVISHTITGPKRQFDHQTGKIDSHTEEIEECKLRFHHVTEQGEAILDLQDESSGTRNLLFLIGPVLDILNKGFTLVIDELDTSLHTLLVRQLVRLFHQSEVNTSGAQLIFTSHDTSLLDAPGLLRRDQIWFVEQAADQASTLYGLSDFSPRKNEALERGYLTGRYGGVPFLQPLTDLHH